MRGELFIVNHLAHELALFNADSILLVVVVAKLNAEIKINVGRHINSRLLHGVVPRGYKALASVVCYPVAVYLIKLTRRLNTCQNLLVERGTPLLFHNVEVILLFKLGNALVPVIVRGIVAAGIGIPHSHNGYGFTLEIFGVILSACGCTAA